mmetsp:Transcript_38207/g.109696  ORF Transcript_38207/g.109696 Transcript_38207/m.109696 type:complete len:372 (+) Transcript_38207:49-1164(+)
MLTLIEEAEHEPLPMPWGLGSSLMHGQGPSLGGLPRLEPESPLLLGCQTPNLPLILGDGSLEDYGPCGSFDSAPPTPRGIGQLRYDPGCLSWDGMASPMGLNNLFVKLQDGLRREEEVRVQKRNQGLNLEEELLCHFSDAGTASNFPPSVAPPSLDFDVEGPRQLQEAAQHMTFHETLAAHYLPMDACAPGVQYAQALHIPQARVEKPASIPGFKAALQHGVVSVGTIGHPSTCADSCPYVKRRGGCKDGAKCPKCHLCFWQRPSVRRVASMQEAEVEASGSATSMTLPPPPPPPHRTPRPSGAQQACGPVFQVVSAQDDVETQDGLPSVGSIGHPHSCGLACKYYSKGKGCKDGRWCIRCHACQWRRYNA